VELALKNAFAIVTLSLLLSACATAPKEAAPADQAPATDGTTQAAPAPDTANENVPDVAMTSTMMQQLMQAELAYKKGDWQGPYLTMMSLAQQTRDPRLAKRAAEMALAAKQADDALAAVRLWRQFSPGSDEASQYYLGLVVLSDNLGEAENILRQRLNEAPRSARGLVMFQMQQLLLRAKDKEAAVAMLKRLVAPYPDMMETHVVLAQAALATGDKAAAQGEARTALGMAPDSEIALLTLAQVSDTEAQATKVLQDFLATHPDAREVRAALARVLVNDKQFEAARQQFLALDKAQPDNPATLYALGVLSMQMSDPAGAEKYLARFVDVVEKQPDDERDPTKAVLMLSQIAEERGDIKGALAWLDRLGGEDPKIRFGAELRRAQLTAKGGDLAGARKLLGTIKPDDKTEQAQVVVAEAQLLREAGKPRDAYRVMEEGVKRYPDNPDLQYDFALMAEKVGRLDVMEKTLRRLIARQPDNQQAYNALGYSLAERNVRLKEAYRLVDKALTLAPEDPFIMDSMGWVHYRMGNLNAAEAQLRKAYALRSDPEIAVHLGEVLWKKGDRDEARKLWREAQTRDPKNDALKNTLARLRASL
jgi:tetratricopeptide (TPR) repeat protein